MTSSAIQATLTSKGGGPKPKGTGVDTGVDMLGRRSTYRVIQEVTMHNQCAGILGLLFGHKYIKSTLTSTHTWDHCWRCGKQAGQ